MTHIHEWSLTGVNVGAYCPGCDTELYPDDIRAALDNTDILEFELKQLRKDHKFVIERENKVMVKNAEFKKIAVRAIKWKARNLMCR